MIRAIIVGAASVALTACANNRPVIVLPPANLAECAQEPLAPILPGKDQQAERDVLMLGYVVALRDAWADCASRIAGLHAWREEMARTR